MDAKFQQGRYGLPDRVFVTLSKRNLLALLHKLEMEASERTITRRVSDDLELIVTVVPDEMHYKDRVPGVMHPETEKFIHGRR